MVFDAVQLHRGGQCTYPCIPGILLTSTWQNFLSELLSKINIVEKMDCGKTDINPVAMTSNQSSERLFAELSDRTRDLLFSSPVR